ncbi:hypothetical protein LDENG_00255380, partial [Lucifuga dentata]
EAGHGGPEARRISSFMSHQTRPGGASRTRRLFHPEDRQRGEVPGRAVPRRKSPAALHRTHRQTGNGVPESPPAQRHHHRG